MGLLEDQDYHCCDHCLIFPPLLPLLLVFLIPSASLSSFPIRFVSYFLLYLLFSFQHVFSSIKFLHLFSILVSGLHIEGKAAGGCCGGEKASESLMRCLSPLSRLDCSFRHRSTTTTMLLCAIHCFLSACKLLLQLRGHHKARFVYVLGECVTEMCV